MKVDAPPTTPIDPMLQAALDALPDGIAVFDSEHRCVMWNARYARLWANWGVTLTPGAASTDLLRAGARAGRYPDATPDIDAWVAERIRLRSQGVVEEFREEFGEHLRFDTRPTPSGGFITTCLNVTDLRLREAKAVAAQGFLDSVVENVPAMLLVKDGETGQFLLANRAAESMLGTPRSDLLGKSDRDFFPAEQAEDFAACDRAVMESGELLTIEEEPLDTPHNGRRWLQTRKIAAPFDDGRRHLLIICEDITERKAAAAALADALERAEAGSIAKSEFLANMSHEIRTPLNGVIGMAEVLSRTPLAEKQREMMQVILNSGRVLNRLLSDILDLSKIESGALDLCPEPMNLREAITAAVAVFEAVAQEKGVRFTLAFAEGFEDDVVGDALRIRQAVANLTSNAVKFTNQGAVAIEAATTRSPDGGVRLSVRVSDTGGGFDAASGDRLFERFQQADGSVTRKVGGSGLGLPIARRLARLMAGDITWSVEPGTGACFVFEAVLAMGEARARGEAAPAAAMPSRRLHVLLAEDHPTNQQVVTLMLSEVADVTIVADGQAAVDAFQHGAFDVVLMDSQMPVLDGLGAIQAIRATELQSGARRTPIISLTANAMPHQVQACLAAGADAHLAKPVSLEGLFAAVAAVQDNVGEAGSRKRA